MREISLSAVVFQPDAASTPRNGQASRLALIALRSGPASCRRTRDPEKELIEALGVLGSMNSDLRRTLAA